MLIASNAPSSSVLNNRFARGLTSFEIPRETPLSSQTRIKPSHTVYVAIKDTQTLAPFPAPSKRAARNCSGELHASKNVQIKKTKVKRKFIAIVYMRRWREKDRFFTERSRFTGKGAGKAWFFLARARKRAQNDLLFHKKSI